MFSARARGRKQREAGEVVASSMASNEGPRPLPVEQRASVAGPMLRVSQFRG
jgi:hypothetical protein